METSRAAPPVLLAAGKERTAPDSAPGAAPFLRFHLDAHFLPPLLKSLSAKLPARVFITGTESRDQPLVNPRPKRALIDSSQLHELWKGNYLAEITGLK